ncbi:SCO family protein [Candidatus Poribacteria bacterium]|nr:MAG: SCO family protein [Candidatus Poribacteria bacterium]
MDNSIENPNQETHRIEKTTIPWIVLGVIILGIAGITLWSTVNSNVESPEPAPLASVPNFSLTNQQGMSFGISDLDGKLWVADFIFTNCPTICPDMTQKMAELQAEIENNKVIFVSITVDPERDTPKVLSQYALENGAEQDRWQFLTGDKDQIYKLANNGFKLAAAYHEGVFPHSTKFVVIKPDRTIHDYYDSRSKAAMQKIRKDIKQLLKNEENN